MKYYLGIDICASSGRHIIDWQKNGEIHMDEVYRFANGTETRNSSLVWNVEHIFSEVQNDIVAALKKYRIIESLSIDAWAVDYVLMRGNEPVMANSFVSQRDSVKSNCFLNTLKI